MELYQLTNNNHITKYLVSRYLSDLKTSGEKQTLGHHTFVILALRCSYPIPLIEVLPG